MEKILTINELSEMTGISSDTLRVYLGHYTLDKFRAIARNERKHKCIGYVINLSFKKAFGEYLEISKGLNFKKRTFELMDEYEKYYKRGYGE